MKHEESTRQFFTVEERRTTVTDYQVKADNIEEAFAVVRSGQGVAICDDSRTELVVRDVPADTG